MGIISIINKYSKLSLKLAIGTAIFDENKSIMTKVKTIQNVNFIDRYFAKDCLLTLAKSRQEQTPQSISVFACSQQK